MRKHRGAIILIGGVCAALGLVMVMIVRSVSTSSLASGGTLLAGDFALTPLTIDETPAIGAESAAPGRSFYVVRIELADRSTSAEFRFDPHHMLVRALDTGKVVRSARGQRALGSDGSLFVGPGKQAVDEVVFEGVSGMRKMNIRFNLLGGPGELVNGLFGPSPSVELAVTKKPS